MPPVNGVFDATNIPPKQLGGSHPIGKFPFQIVKTECVQTKSGDGGMFVVTFQTPAGEIPFRFNLWNQSQKAVEIANGQLSALCHVTGIFKVGFQDEGRALIGGQGIIDVGFQKGEDPSAERPEGGFTEIKKFLDRNGNEPGKAPAAPQPQTQPQMQPAPQPNNPPMTQGSDGGWGSQQPQPPANPGAPQGGGWPTNNPPVAAPQPQPNPAPAGNAPPWARG